ncbi:hypothetical protein [Roseomonas sp. CECT 9278]|uniref:hypothetical protein n=1 Tax=Roseomonas sp. CECT 9278 TaxID=2845823 RepID=UPI001E38778E|nr:hypothetical protein [Roseomonas sp. CECT 9278]CAH0295013.1 hypothetical protein ROS9278_04348 [Roseomonas sp. CECT 9278]
MASGLDRHFARAAAVIAQEAERGAPLALAVTAAAAREGVTTCTALLARELSGVLGLRVLLVDLAGGRLPVGDALARLGAPPAILADDAVARSAAPLALVVAEGGLPALRPRLSALVVAAGTARFDVVLVDAPAADAGPAAMIAARCCGQALIVIRAGNLPAEAIERLQQDLAQAQVGVIGAVLNQRREVVPGWIDRLLR